MRCQDRPTIEDDIWRFERLVRKVEYYRNCKRSSLSRLYPKWLYYRFHILGRKLGFIIPPNVFGPGLAILHRGTIVVNFQARIGKNCRVNTCVNIGTDVKYLDKAPRIGNNVYIGPGAKIFGDIQIANDIAIGANAVVNSSFNEPGTL